MGIVYNPLSGQFQESGTSSGGGGGSTYFKDPVANQAALPLLGNSTGDVRLVEDENVFYSWDGAAWNAVGFGSSLQTEKFTLDATDITNKYVTLAFAPTVPSLTRLVVITGLEQDLGTDFDVSGDEVTWDSLFLDGVLVLGDKLIITYI